MIPFDVDTESSLLVLLLLMMVVVVVVVLVVVLSLSLLLSMLLLLLSFLLFFTYLMIRFQKRYFQTHTASFSKPLHFLTPAYSHGLF